MFFELVLCALAGYLVGTFNPSFFISKLKGFDLRDRGSGNAGGSNALITMGKLIGFLCIIVDIAKAAIIISIMSALFSDNPASYAITAVACILGHMFPFYMHFKGGKGLACLGGAIIAFSPLFFVIILAAECAFGFLVDYIFVVPITASVIFPVAYGVMSGNYLGMSILFIATAFMLYKLVENIKRWRKGTELRLSYLWKGEKEANRVIENSKKP